MKDIVIFVTCFKKKERKDRKEEKEKKRGNLMRKMRVFQFGQKDYIGLNIGQLQPNIEANIHTATISESLNISLQNMNLAKHFV